MLQDWRMEINRNPTALPKKIVCRVWFWRSFAVGECLFGDHLQCTSQLKPEYKPQGGKVSNLIVGYLLFSFQCPLHSDFEEVIWNFRLVVFWFFVSVLISEFIIIYLQFYSSCSIFFLLNLHCPCLSSPKGSLIKHRNMLSDLNQIMTRRSSVNTVITLWMGA